MGSKVLGPEVTHHRHMNPKRQERNPPKKRWGVGCKVGVVGTLVLRYCTYRVRVLYQPRLHYPSLPYRYLLA